MHYQCDRFFCYAFKGDNGQLLSYLFETAHLQKLIISAMEEKDVGYHGWMMRLVDVIQYVFEQHEEYKKWKEDEEWNQFLEETQKPILSKREEYTNQFKSLYVCTNNQHMQLHNTTTTTFLFRPSTSRLITQSYSDSLIENFL